MVQYNNNPKESVDWNEVIHSLFIQLTLPLYFLEVMPMKYTITCIFALLCSAFALQAQDQHFTQFYASPLTLNPALSGSFEGTYRFSLIYRDQWKGILDNPFVTYSAAADFRFNMKKRGKQYKDAVGGGVLFYNDQVSVTGFSNNQIIVSGAFHKSLSKQNDQFLSLGLQAGISQRNINYAGVDFQDQFNGSNGYSNPTGEVLPENNFAYGDYSVGLNYTYSPARSIGFFAGVAMHHIMEPSISFFYDEEDPDRVDDNKLFRKYTAHLNVMIPIGESVQISPRALYYTQGPHMAANAGANLRFLINQSNGMAFHLGSWVRGTQDETNSPFMDAVVLMTGIEINNFLVGLSYDANLKALNTGGRNQGAFELSIAYLGEYEDDTVLCPKF